MAPEEFLAPLTAPVVSVRTMVVIIQCLVEPQILHQLVDIKELKVHYFYTFLTELGRPISLFTSSRSKEVAR